MSDQEEIVRRIFNDPEDCFYPIGTRCYMKRHGHSYHISLKSEAAGGGGRLIIPEGDVRQVAEALLLYVRQIEDMRVAATMAARVIKEIPDAAPSAVTPAKKTK